MTNHTGTARPITRYGARVLHTPCKPVTRFDAALQRLIDDMFASMYAARGWGLAANQIGVGLRVFVYDCPDQTGINQVGHVVNPVLLPASALAPLSNDEEGCLSVPRQRAALARPGLATVTGLDRTGAPVTVTGTGPLARCLQHETQHLQGVVYVDLLDERQRREILSAAGLAP